MLGSTETERIPSSPLYLLDADDREEKPASINAYLPEVGDPYEKLSADTDEEKASRAYLPPTR
jgi:hypothetical protein